MASCLSIGNPVQISVNSYSPAESSFCTKPDNKLLFCVLITYFILPILIRVLGVCTTCFHHIHTSSMCDIIEYM